MTEAKPIPTYQYLGTLASTLYLTARVARKEDDPELLVVNQVPHRPQTREFFRQLYASFARRPERSDFRQLFSVQQDFYAVFRYYEGPALASLYAGCPGPAEKRIQMLIAALFAVCRVARDLPESVVCGLLQPENLLVNKDGAISLLYQFQPEFLVGETACSVWGQAASLIEFMMEKELKKPYHKHLRTVYQMCQAGLYESLPALISDLQKVAAALPETGPVQSAVTFVQRHKARLAQLSWLGIVTLFACLVVYLFTSLLGGQTASVVPIADIGTITYVAAQNEENGEIQLQDPDSESAGGEVTVSSLPDSSADLTSEDYIVQPGDTLASVCVGYYGAAGYAELVASFNGVPADQPLEAGSVLLLPQRDQLAPYIQN